MSVGCVLNKWDDIEPLFKVDEEILPQTNERSDIYIASHKIYGIVFVDDMGYCINKYLIMGGF